jgi:hypothetical protein
MLAPTKLDGSAPRPDLRPTSSTIRGARIAIANGMLAMLKPGMRQVFYRFSLMAIKGDLAVIPPTIQVTTRTLRDRRNRQQRYYRDFPRAAQPWIIAPNPI